MSSIYIQEPPTSGKVLLHTTVGDIDVELWSKETPKACRNFIQLCLENYYSGTIFHRVIKGFIAQGGDPNGDGTGGESIYGHPFKDEFHSRLRFVRRGLVAMANSGKDDNGSQFFFTLGSTPELQNKNTIFGKVTGNTLYNMLKLEEGLVDEDDRPFHPHKIISSEILQNPFPDIVPRLSEKIVEIAPTKPKEKIKKNFKLLSFGEEAEEDEEEMNAVNEIFKGQSKSSHDLTNDPKLSSVPAIDVSNKLFERKTDDATLNSIREKFEKASSDKKMTKNIDVNTDDFDAMQKSSTDQKAEERKDIQKQIREIKRELRKKKSVQPQETVENCTEEEQEVEENDLLCSYHTKKEEYRNKLKTVPEKGTSLREKQTLELLEKFKKNIEKAKGTGSSCEEANSDSENDDKWLAHCLREDDEKKIVLAKDANLPSSDRYDLSDPRNPMTERRREKKQKISK